MTRIQPYMPSHNGMPLSFHAATLFIAPEIAATFTPDRIRRHEYSEISHALGQRATAAAQSLVAEGVAEAPAEAVADLVTQEWDTEITKPVVDRLGGLRENTRSRLLEGEELDLIDELDKYLNVLDDQPAGEPSLNEQGLTLEDLLVDGRLDDEDVQVADLHRLHRILSDLVEAPDLVFGVEHQATRRVFENTLARLGIVIYGEPILVRSVEVHTDQEQFIAGDKLAVVPFPVDLHPKRRPSTLRDRHFMVSLPNRRRQMPSEFVPNIFIGVGVSIPQLAQVGVKKAAAA